MPWIDKHSVERHKGQSIGLQAGMNGYTYLNNSRCRR